MVQKEELQVHLKACLNCQEQLADLKQLDQSLSVYPMIETGEDFTNNFWQKVRNIEAKQVVPNTAGAYFYRFALGILFLSLAAGAVSGIPQGVTEKQPSSEWLRNAKKLKISPVKMMISIAVSSNLQGAATLIGDPPSMLLGGFAKINFGDFFFYKGRPSIFFAVEIGALVSFLVLYLVFRKHKEKAELQINPQLLLFGLLIGASLGGNITPIGAAANIVACGLLKEEGYHVGFKDFAKIGLPFTLSAVSAAYLFVWFVWSR